MEIRPSRVAMFAGLAGLAASTGLVIASLVRSSPLGPGENIEWLLSYLLLIGFPTSLLVALLRPLFSWLSIAPVLVRVVMVLAVVINWSLLGYIVAKVLVLVRRRPDAGPPPADERAGRV